MQYRDAPTWMVQGQVQGLRYRSMSAWLSFKTKLQGVRRRSAAHTDSSSIAARSALLHGSALMDDRQAHVGTAVAQEYAHMAEPRILARTAVAC